MKDGEHPNGGYRSVRKLESLRPHHPIEAGVRTQAGRDGLRQDPLEETPAGTDFHDDAFGNPIETSLELSIVFAVEGTKERLGPKEIAVDGDQLGRVGF